MTEHLRAFWSFLAWHLRWSCLVSGWTRRGGRTIYGSAGLPVWYPHILSPYALTSEPWFLTDINEASRGRERRSGIEGAGSSHACICLELVDTSRRTQMHAQSCITSRSLWYKQTRTWRHFPVPSFLRIALISGMCCFLASAVSMPAWELQCPKGRIWGMMRFLRWRPKLGECPILPARALRERRRFGSAIVRVRLQSSARAEVTKRRVMRISNSYCWIQRKVVVLLIGLVVLKRAAFNVIHWVFLSIECKWSCCWDYGICVPSQRFH